MTRTLGNIMYKKAIALILSLAACGGAYVEQPVQTSLSETIIHAPIGEPTTFFTMAYMGMIGIVADGQGKDAKEAAYDALAWMATNKWVAGTEAYKAMLSADGLIVVMTEDDTGTMYKGVVRMTVQGLEIDVVEVV